MTAKYNCKTRDSVKVRPAPNTNNTSIGSMSLGTDFQISEIVPDSLDPTNPAKKWGHIFGGVFDEKYTALEYPNNISPISTYTLIEGVPDPDPTPEPEPINEFREVGLSQKFLLINGEQVLRVSVTNPNETTLVEIFVGKDEGTLVQWFRPE